MYFMCMMCFNIDDFGLKTYTITYADLQSHIEVINNRIFNKLKLIQQLFIQDTRMKNRALCSSVPFAQQ
jgi:hypothetical protein